jgi:hypothetical protein
MGDVKRLLRSSARIIPVSKFVGDDEVSFLGAVSFSVLYIDSDNKLTEAAFTKDFEHNEKLTEGIRDAYISFDPAALSVRLSGPRKICAKASVGGEICVTDMGIPQKCELSRDAEIKESTIYIHSAEFLSSEEREYIGELCRLEEVGKDEIESVALFHDCAPASVSVTDNAIDISSVVSVKAILRVDGDLTHAECEVPIALSINAIATSDCLPSADVIITDCKVNFNEEVDSAGDMTTCAAVTVSIRINARVDSNKPCEVINDAFMPSMNNECIFESIKYDNAKCLHNECAQIEFFASGNENGLADVLYYECLPSYYSMQVVGNVGQITGEINYLAVVMGNDGVPDAVKGSYPFDVAIKLPVTRKNEKIQHNIDVICNSVSIDGDGLRFVATLGATVFVIDEKEEIILKSLRYSDKDQSATRKITVYYPEYDESAWDIAKKYAIRVDDILAENPDGFDSDMRSSVKRVMILGS